METKSHPTCSARQQGRYRSQVILIATILILGWDAQSLMAQRFFPQRSEPQPPAATRGAPQRSPAQRPANNIQPGRPSNSRETHTVPPSTSGKTQKESIWATDAGGSTRGDAYFRRTLNLPSVEYAHIEIESSDTCEIFLNGKRVAATRTPGTSEKIDLVAFVEPGQNVLAVRALHRTNRTPYISAGFYFKPTEQNWRIVVSDSTWKVSKAPQQGWQGVQFNDSGWLAARPLGSPATTQPVERSLANLQDKKEPFQSVSSNAKLSDASALEAFASDSTKLARPTSFANSSETYSDGKLKSPTSGRFNARKGFQVEEIFPGSEVGSIIAMTFNEFGHIIASQERGPLLLIYDSDKDGEYDKVREYCNLVENIQGILALNGDVYVTGTGKDGSGLYRLIDSDRNGELEKAEILVRFKGVPGEHGPHQIAFGPDGALYLAVGNHSWLDSQWPEQSTYPKPYEGDLVQPRFEDPGGHADGVKAPGGTIIRYELTTQSVEVVAGGLRNAYDLAFHPSGAAYTFDSDMEADIGSVWHRDTSLFKIVEGGEYGWRSGWANWPEHYIDRLPSLASSGRASPTGMVFYNHHVYPTKYHRSLFLADWSEGRILSYNVEQDNATRQPMEEFVVGTPMNVTDIDVGPEGHLYFCTGGRGTEGGIYRVTWTGEVPSQVTNLGTGITKAIRQPQLNSAYGRQAAALVKKELGDEWGELVAGVAYSTDNPAKYRIQALDLMQMLGPMPTPELLIDLSKSNSDVVRTKCARLMGLHSETPVAERLVTLLEDSSPSVRQAAMESMLRIGVVCDPGALMGHLQSDAREERFLARRLLALIPEQEWKEEFLASSSNRLVINSALVLATTAPNRPKAIAALDAMERVADGFVSDADFVDLLRVAQLSFHLTKLDENTNSRWRTIIENEFPAGNATINAELARLATHLESDIVPEALDYLMTDAPMPERMLVAMHLPMIDHEWTSKERMTLLQFLESAQKVSGGGSYQLYVMRTAASMASFLTEEESLRILTLGEQYPNAALAALFKLPSELDDESVQTLIELDRAVDQGGLEDDVFKRLKTGLTAILSGQDSEAAAEHLRDRWRQSPDRRATIATAMAQQPNDENWDYLVRSLGYLDLFAVKDVAEALMKLDVATDDPDAIRQAIIQGCKLEEAGQSSKPIDELLAYWTGEEPVEPHGSNSGMNANKKMVGWQRWFEIQFPDLPPAVLASAHEQPRWSLEFLEQFLDGDQGKYGSREQGAMLFARAQCAACHKHNNQGSGFGPDLTSVAKRFTKTEFLESVLFPSHIISDQYASQKVLTVHGDAYTGIVVQSPGAVTVRVNQSKDIRVAEEDIEEILPSKISTMPAGLFDDLTPAEIRDLLCFFGYVPEETNIAEGQESKTIRR